MAKLLPAARGIRAGHNRFKGAMCSDNSPLRLAGTCMFRITIREIILLTLITALAVGWIIEHRRAHRLELSLSNAQASLANSNIEIRRLHRVNEITAGQWAKALGQLNASRDSSPD